MNNDFIYEADHWTYEDWIDGRRPVMITYRQMKVIVDEIERLKKEVNSLKTLEDFL